MNTDCVQRLRQEREKLNRLMDEALKNGTPISETYGIMNQCKKMKRMKGEAGKGGNPALRYEAVCAQSRRVDALIARVEREREKQPSIARPALPSPPPAG